MYYDFALLIITRALRIDIGMSRKGKVDNSAFIWRHRLEGNRPSSIASLVRKPARKVFEGGPSTFLIAAYVDAQHRPLHLL